jgi:cbb3-type cytochrome oxidase subunit 3
MIDWIAAHAGMIGLLFFFGFFVLMAAWVFRPGAKAGYFAQSCIPLKDKDHE